MRILFDIWLKAAEGFEYTPEEEIIFEEIHNYIYDRLFIIIDKIDKEEEDNNPKAIMVYLLEKPKKIQPRGYSVELEEKILNCFNDNDAAMIWKRVEDGLTRLLN